MRAIFHNIPGLLCTLLILSLCSCKPAPVITVVFTGDLMLDRGVRTLIQKKGVDHLFSIVKPLFRRSDLVLGNLECAVCAGSLKAADKTFTFRGESAWLPAIRASGITHLSLANNHSSDFGEEGLNQTAAAVQQAGLHTLGYHPDGSQACDPVVLEKNGVQIAVFSASLLQSDTHACLCSGDADTLSYTIRRFRAEHPSSPIVIFLHWGGEMRTQHASSQEEQAHAFIDSGADLIVGHHPHVVQDIGLYKGKYIFYSLGNFIFDNPQPEASKGLMVSTDFHRSGISAIHLVPFNGSRVQPALMGEDEARKFMKSLGERSPQVKLKPDNKGWRIGS